MAFSKPIRHHHFFRKGNFLKKNNEKKIGLALGGGAVLGAAHVGVLRAVEEFGVQIDCIAGTSIGAFVAALWAFGKKADEIEEIASDLNWLDISALSLSKFGLLSNKKLGDRIREVVGEKTFAHSRIPLAMVATDIASGDRVVLQKGDVATAVMASTCIPGVFVPVEIGGRLLVDGFIVENVPVTAVQELGARQVIAVDLNAVHTTKEPLNIVEILLHTFNFALRSATQLLTQEADLLIAPDLSEFNLVEIKQVPELIEKGYQQAKSQLRKMV